MPRTKPQTKIGENKKKIGRIASPAIRTGRTPERFSVRFCRAGGRIAEACNPVTELDAAIALAKASYRKNRLPTWVWSIRTGKTLHTVGGVAL